MAVESSLMKGWAAGSMVGEVGDGVGKERVGVEGAVVLLLLVEGVGEQR